MRIKGIVGLLSLSLMLTPVRFAQNEGLRARATTRDFFIGAAVSMKPFATDDEYRQKLAREFNVIVAENAFKFDAIHPEAERYDFEDADAIVDFAATHNMKVRGHTLIWYKQLPAWVKEGTFSRDQAIDILTKHIETVVGRYRGKVWAWDVVNEAVDQNGDQKRWRTDSFWYRTIGPDHVRIAFEVARKADPDAILYYNDFANEEMDDRSTAVYRLASELRQLNLIDGVGWQMHTTAGSKITNEHRENIRRLGELGLEVSITELDVRMKVPPDRNALEKQATTYREATKFCLSEPNCRALVLWGFTDRYSWVPDFFPGDGDALIFDANYRAKPAYFAIRETLEEALRGRPIIREASFEGNDLIVRGDGLDKKGTVFINWRAQKTAPGKGAGGTSLLVKDAARGNQTQTGKLRLHVQNGDGKLSFEFEIVWRSGF
jgi:endo-1,4-beta-xylanase